MTVTCPDAVVVASLARQGSRSPNGGVGACRSGQAEAVKGCVLAQPGGQGHAGRELLQFPAGIRGVGDHVDGPAGQRGDGPAMRRASHSREDEVVPLMTSLASTGIATGRPP